MGGLWFDEQPLPVRSDPRVEPDCCLSRRPQLGRPYATDGQSHYRRLSGPVASRCILQENFCTPPTPATVPPPAIFLCLRFRPLARITEVTPRTNVGSSPTLLAMDSAGAFLYVGNSGSGSISAFSIDSGTGALTEVAGSPFPIGLTPINMKVSPSGSTLYVTGGFSNGNVSAGIIEVFNLNQGVLSVVAGSPFLTGTESFRAGHLVQRRISVHRQHTGQFHFRVHDQCRRISRRTLRFSHRRAVRGAGHSFHRQIRSLFVRGQSRLKQPCGLFHRLRWFSRTPHGFSVWHRFAAEQLSH